MVGKQFKIHFVCLVAGLLPASGEALDFYMEAAKKDFYQGENINVSFIIAAKADTLDVEVVKFPEFQSFWSENTVLRQGPIPLLSSINVFEPPSRFIPQIPLEELIQKFKVKHQNLEKKAVVGSYTITAMVGREDMKIEPMKLAVRETNGRGSLSLLSRMPELTIRRLPSPPEDLSALFKGAVGNFALEVENTEIAYRLGEPAVLRINLRGDGNYADINEVPIRFPAGVEVLSMRSQMLQTGQDNVKSFEYTLSITSNEMVMENSLPFVFFNPVKNRFQKIETTAPQFRLAEKTEENISAGKALLLPIEKAWSRSRSILSTLPSLLLQLGLLLLALGHMLYVHLEKLKRKKHIGVAYIREQKVKAIESTLQKGQTTMACEELTHFIDELLKQEFDGSETCPSFLSRAQKLNRLEKRAGREVRLLIEEYLSKHDHSRFSADKAPFANPDSRLKNLFPVIQKLIA